MNPDESDRSYNWCGLLVHPATTIKNNLVVARNPYHLHKSVYFPATFFTKLSPKNLYLPEMNFRAVVACYLLNGMLCTRTIITIFNGGGMICYFGTHMKGLGKQLAKFMERIREKKKNTDERKGMVIDPNSRRGLSPHIAKDIGWIDPLGGGRRTMIDMPPIGWLW